MIVVLDLEIWSSGLLQLGSTPRRFPRFVVRLADRPTFVLPPKRHPGPFWNCDRTDRLL